MNFITDLFKSKPNSDELTLEYWELTVTEGIMAAIHGSFQTITEIYIPELNLSLNTAHGQFNIFISDKKRYANQSSNSFGAQPAPKQINTIIIHKTSAIAQILTEFAEFYKNKVEKEKHLEKLFSSLYTGVGKTPTP